MKLINPEPAIPHEVVGLVVKSGYSLLRAWREYLGKSQEEVAATLHRGAPGCGSPPVRTVAGIRAVMNSTKFHLQNP